jgi:hypothetical protein
MTVQPRKDSFAEAAPRGLCFCGRPNTSTPTPLSNRCVGQTLPKDKQPSRADGLRTACPMHLESHWGKRPWGEPLSRVIGLVYQRILLRGQSSTRHAGEGISFLTYGLQRVLPYILTGGSFTQRPVFRHWSCERHTLTGATMQHKTNSSATTFRYLRSHLGPVKSLETYVNATLKKPDAGWFGEMIPSRYKGFERPDSGHPPGTLRAPRPMSCWHLIDFVVSRME